MLLFIRFFFASFAYPSRGIEMNPSRFMLLTLLML